MNDLESPTAAATQIGSNSYERRNARYWRTNLVVCVFGSFTTLLSLSLLLPFLPLYVQQLGVRSQSAIVQWSGVAFGATFLGTAVTAPVWGHLADRYGRKPMLIRAAVGMAITMSLIGLVHGVMELVALRLAAGLIGGFASASIVMIGAQAPRERAGWALGTLSTGSLTGNVAGPLVGGFLPGWVGIRGTFFVAGALIAVTALLTLLFVHEDFNCDDACRRATVAPVPSLQVPGRRGARRVTLTLLLTAMMVLLANMSIEPVITVYVAGLGVAAGSLTHVAGIVMAASALGSLLTASRLGALADRIGSWNVIIGCLVATGLTMVPQAFVTQWLQLAALRVLMGMTIAGLLPSIAKLVRQSVDVRDLGTMLGTLQSAQFSGQVVGPLLGGLIAVHLGLPSVFLVTGALLLACAGFNLWARRARPDALQS